MIPILGFNGRLELENFDKNGVPNPHEAASYHGHQAHHAASACAAAAVAVAGLAPNLVDSSDLSNELWLHASANGPNGPDFEAAVNAAAAAGYAKEHHPHQGSAASAASAAASNYYHPYEANQALNLTEYSPHGDMVPYGPDPMVVDHQHYEFYEQPPIEPFGYYDYVTT